MGRGSGGGGGVGGGGGGDDDDIGTQTPRILGIYSTFVMADPLML